MAKRSFTKAQSQVLLCPEALLKELQARPSQISNDRIQQLNLACALHIAAASDSYLSMRFF